MTNIPPPPNTPQITNPQRPSTASPTMRCADTRLTPSGQGGSLEKHLAAFETAISTLLGPKSTEWDEAALEEIVKQCGGQIAALLRMQELRANTTGWTEERRNQFLEILMTPFFKRMPAIKNCLHLFTLFPFGEKITAATIRERVGEESQQFQRVLQRIVTTPRIANNLSPFQIHRENYLQMEQLPQLYRERPRYHYWLTSKEDKESAAENPV